MATCPDAPTLAKSPDAHTPRRAYHAGAPRHAHIHAPVLLAPPTGHKTNGFVIYDVDLNLPPTHMKTAAKPH